MTQLSAREKMLGLAVGGIVILLLNLLLLSAFARKNATLRSELKQGQLEEAGMQELLSQQDLWAQRDTWINSKQPKLSNEGAAGVELLDLVRTTADKARLTVENPTIGTITRSQWARSVSVSIETHSSWPDLIQFLRSIQQPDQFIVFETGHVQVDATDPTKMFGRFKIARWYALD